MYVRHHYIDVSILCISLYFSELRRIKLSVLRATKKIKRVRLAFWWWYHGNHNYYRLSLCMHESFNIFASMLKVTIKSYDLTKIWLCFSLIFKKAFNSNENDRQTNISSMHIRKEISKSINLYYMLKKISLTRKQINYFCTTFSLRVILFH